MPHQHFSYQQYTTKQPYQPLSRNLNRDLLGIQGEVLYCAATPKAGELPYLKSSNGITSLPIIT